MGSLVYQKPLRRVSPHTRIQLCMVHMVRNSLKYVSYKHRKEIEASLKLIYGAATEAEAQVYLELFAEKWDRLYPSISKLWRTHWSRVIPLFAFPEDIRKVIYTTNATLVGQYVFTQSDTQSSDFSAPREAVFKVIYLAIQNIAKKWTMPIHNWKPALNCFALEFADRFPQ